MERKGKKDRVKSSAPGKIPRYEPGLEGPVTIKDREKRGISNPFRQNKSYKPLDEMESFIKKHNKASPQMGGSLVEATQDMIIDKKGLLLFLLDQVINQNSDIRLQSACENLVNALSSLDPSHLSEVFVNWQHLRFLAKKSDSEEEKSGEEGVGDGALWEPLLVCFSGFMAPAFSPFKEMLRGLIQEIDTDIKNTLPPPGIANETDLSGVKELPNDLVQRMTNKLVMLLFTFLFSDPSLIPFLFRIICHTIHTNHENSERAQREILACLNHFVFAPSFRALNEEMCLSSVVKNFVFKDIPHKISILCKSQNGKIAQGESDFINTHSPAAMNFAQSFCTPDPPQFLPSDPQIAVSSPALSTSAGGEGEEDAEGDEGNDDGEHPKSPSLTSLNPTSSSPSPKPSRSLKARKKKSLSSLIAPTSSFSSTSSTPDPLSLPSSSGSTPPPSPATSPRGRFPPSNSSSFSLDEGCVVVDFIMGLQFLLLDFLASSKFSSTLAPEEETYSAQAYDVALFIMSLKPFDWANVEAERKKTKGSQVEGSASENAPATVITHQLKVDLLELLLFDPHFLFSLEKAPRVRYKEGAKKVIDILIGTHQIASPLAGLIKVTVQNSQQGTLMRTDSFCTTLITKYAMSVIEPQHGFLRKLLGPLVREVEALVRHHPFEKDIALLLAGKVISSILSDPLLIPESLRILLTILKKEVIKCGLGNGRSAVGGMLLLRILLPCVTMPTLFDGKLEVTNEVKQYLIFISRMIQNLSNGTLPRAEDMQYTHELLKSKKADVEAYLDGVSCVEESVLEKTIVKKEDIEESFGVILIKTEKGLVVLSEYLMTTKVEVEKYFETLSEHPKIEQFYAAIPAVEYVQEKEKEKKEKKEKKKAREKEREEKEKEREREKEKESRERERERRRREKERKEKERKVKREEKDKDKKPRRGTKVRLSEEFGEERMSGFLASLTNLIMNDSHFMFHLEGVVSHKDLKKMSDTILDALSLSKYPLLPLLRLLETSIGDSEKGTLMRTDSLCTTLLCRYSIYRCEEMQVYLKKIFEPIKGIWDNVSFPLSEETTLTMLEKYVDCIFTPQTDLKIPEHIQIFCTCIRNNVVKCELGNELVAVGGFLMLRVIVPCISSPSLYGDDSVIDPELKKNLLLLSKLVQCLSNRTTPRGTTLAYTHPLLKKREKDVEVFLDSVSKIQDSKISEFFISEVPRQEIQYFSEKAEGPLTVFFEMIHDLKDEFGNYFQNEYVEQKTSSLEFLNSLVSSPPSRNFSPTPRDKREEKNLISLRFPSKDKEKIMVDRGAEREGKKERKKTITNAPPPGSLSPVSHARKSIRIQPVQAEAGSGLRIPERDENLPFWKTPLVDTVYETEKLHYPHPFFVILSVLESRQADKTYRIFKESGEAANAVCRLVQMAYPKSDFDLTSFSVPSIATAFAKMLQELPTPLISLDAIIAILFLERTDTLKTSDGPMMHFLVTTELMSLFPPSHCSLIMRFFLLLGKIVCNEEITNVSMEDAVNIVLDIIRPGASLRERAKRGVQICLHHILPPTSVVRKPVSRMRVKTKVPAHDIDIALGDDDDEVDPGAGWARSRALSRSSSLLHTSGVMKIGGGAIGGSGLAVGSEEGLSSPNHPSSPDTDSLPSSPVYNPLSPPNSTLSPLLSSASPPCSPVDSPSSPPNSPPLSPGSNNFRLPQKHT